MREESDKKAFLALLGPRVRPLLVASKEKEKPRTDLNNLCFLLFCHKMCAHQQVFRMALHDLSAQSGHLFLL